MKHLPDRFPDLSDFLRITSSDVPGRVTHLVAEALGGRAALLLLDIDGLYLHPTATLTAYGEEKRELMGVSVPLSEPGEHTLSEVVFGQRTLEMSREEWSGVTPLDDEYLTVVPVKMADQMVGTLLVGSDEPLGEERLRALEFMGDQAGAALVTAERYSDAVWRARRRSMPSVAAQVQEDLLPLREQYLPHMSIAGKIEPAYDVGGDWFDYALVDDGLFVAVADVSGKGLAAEHLASTAFGTVRSARRAGKGLSGIASAVGEVLEEVASPDQFVTMLLALIDPTAREVELLNAGHPGPILVPARAERPARPLPIARKNPPVGVLRGEEAPEYVTERHILEPGSRLLFYSDGVTERRDDAGRMLGDEGLARLVEGSRDLAAMPFVHNFLRQIVSYGEERLTDDATVLVVGPGPDGEGKFLSPSRDALRETNNG